MRKENVRLTSIAKYYIYTHLIYIKAWEALALHSNYRGVVDRLNEYGDSARHTHTVTGGVRKKEGKQGK